MSRSGGVGAVALWAAHGLWGWLRELLVMVAYVPVFLAILAFIPGLPVMVILAPAFYLTSESHGEKLAWGIVSVVYITEAVVLAAYYGGPRAARWIRNVSGRVREVYLHGAGGLEPAKDVEAPSAVVAVNPDGSLCCATEEDVVKDPV